MLVISAHPMQDIDTGNSMEKAMYNHILVATDGSELAGKAVTAGVDLAKQLNAKLTIVTVTEPWTSMVIGEGAALSFPIEDYEKASKVSATRILDAASAVAKGQSVAVDTVHVVDSPAEGIIATAKDKGCDLIVMSSHGRRGLARVLLGSQATRVLTLSTVPVLICR
jgi:nucleotide-binding universal stress UspA family protein